MPYPFYRRTRYSKRCKRGGTSATGRVGFRYLPPGLKPPGEPKSMHRQYLAALILVPLLGTGCRKPAAPTATATTPGETAPVDPVPAHDSFTIASRAVAETRMVNVHTPEGYK